jgi:hypothetical protein
MPRGHGDNHDDRPGSSAPDHPVSAGAISISRQNGDDTTEDRDMRSVDEAKKRHKAGLAKKLQFMTHLMKSFDMMVYAELCVLYYME